MIRILRLDDSPFTISHVYTFIRTVYADRSVEGIDFWLSKCSFDEYAEKVRVDKKIIFVAFTPDTEELLGTHLSLFVVIKRGVNTAECQIAQ